MCLLVGTVTQVSDVAREPLVFLGLYYKYCIFKRFFHRCVPEILPIRRNILINQSINQSNNQSINQSNDSWLNTCTIWFLPRLSSALLLLHHPTWHNRSGKFFCSSVFHNPMLHPTIFPFCLCCFCKLSMSIIKVQIYCNAFKIIHIVPLHADVTVLIKNCLCSSYNLRASYSLHLTQRCLEFICEDSKSWQ